MALALHQYYWLNLVEPGQLLFPRTFIQCSNMYHTYSSAVEMPCLSQLRQQILSKRLASLAFTWAKAKHCLGGRG